MVVYRPLRVSQPDVLQDEGKLPDYVFESALYLWVSYVLMVDYNILKAPLQGQWTKVHQDTLKLG